MKETTEAQRLMKKVSESPEQTDKFALYFGRYIMLVFVIGFHVGMICLFFTILILKLFGY